MTEEKKPDEISRREFLRDAGLLVGSTAIGSTVFLTACGGDAETITKTVTTTALGSTSTVTKTEQVSEATETTTQTVNKFICPVDGEEFESLAELQAHYEAEHGGVTTANLNIITLTINGKPISVQVQPEWSLQYLLHDRLGWTEVKDMCTGYGACGACTVIMDGRPILSCMALACECNGATIETTQGIARDKHPIIDSYVKYQTRQCGYCTPGFVATAKALLDRNPSPSIEEIREALAGNLCRCGTYPQHILAIQDAANTLSGGSN